MNLKSEHFPEAVRACTPALFGLSGLIIILCALFNSEKLVGDRFAYVIGAAGAFGGYAAGGYSPSQRQQPQTKVNHADQVDIDQSK